MQKQKLSVLATSVPTMDDEVENVEYLEDCIADDVVEVNGRLTAQQHSTVDDPTFVDTFYPNAVQCLIALYRDKYDKQMNNPQEICKLYKSVWEDISRVMRESYFDFDAEQVRQKFIQLRQQYLGVTSKSDIQGFEYFQPFHEIYNDKIISSYLNSDHPITYNIQNTNIPRSYRDDILFGTLPQPEMHEVADKQKQTDEIAHKEQEFMIMMERELQAIDGDNGSKVEVKAELTTMKRERTDWKEVNNSNSQSSKRTKVDEPISLHINQQNSVKVLNEKVQSEGRHNNKGDMTLSAYNEAQQRRHEEKMDLLRQTIILQERLMEVQSKLLEQIVKRVK